MHPSTILGERKPYLYSHDLWASNPLAVAKAAHPCGKPCRSTRDARAEVPASPSGAVCMRIATSVILEFHHGCSILLGRDSPHGFGDDIETITP